MKPFILCSLPCWLLLAHPQAATETKLPRFEDYPASDSWSGTPAAPKLTSRSERMFRTRIREAADEPPNFAGHYRLAIWGCGSNCAAAALIDLESGLVFPPPLGDTRAGWARWIVCGAMFDDRGIEYRLGSRLMIVRCGMNYDQHEKNHPDVHYFVWENREFKRLLHLRSPRSETR